MKKTLLKTTAIIGIVSAPLLIIGCGGGSSSTTATSAGTFSKITGTVPGTLIEAFCADGSYAQVTSTQDGTAQHPFEITVPQNVECRLVMTTNENDPINRVVTPIGFATATATGLTLSLNQDLNLGYVPLAMDPNAVPTVNNMVVDPLIVDITAATTMDTNMTAVADPAMATTMDTNMTTTMDPAMTTPAMPVATVTAAPIPAFDANGNGVIDAYEDMNGNGVMDAYDPDYTSPTMTTPTTYVDDDKGSTDDYDDDKGSSDDDNYMTTGTTTTMDPTTGTTTTMDPTTGTTSDDDYDDDDKGSSDNDYDDDDKGSNDDDNDDDKGSDDN